ncbi:MAG: Clp protease ClpP [Blautia sp.]|nr:Clp protease ClpP [Blautia sp.]
MRKFYQIATSGRTAEINIYGNITQDAETLNAIVGEDTGMVSAHGIVSEIQGLDVDNINVYINSYGGEVAEALAIYSTLKRHSASIHTYCDGFACSAATIVFCAGDVRTMGSIALMMIHDCMSYLGYANSAAMRKAAEDNDKINQSSINAYLAVSNLSEEEIRGLMAKETWLTAEECLEYGFATDIAKEEESDKAQQSAFGSIREAVLNRAGERNTLAEINRQLAKILEALKDDEDEEEPEEKDAKNDPDEEPESPDEPDDQDDTPDDADESEEDDTEEPDDDQDEEDPDDDKDTVNAALEFFSKLFS